MNAGESASGLAAELGVDAVFIWRERLQPGEKDPGRQREGGAGERSAAAEASAGGQGARGGFFARCLAQNRGATPGEWKGWREGIYDQIREVMPVQGSLSVGRMCHVAMVSRAGYYLSGAQSGRRRDAGAVDDAADRDGASAAVRLSAGVEGTAGSWDGG